MFHPKTSVSMKRVYKNVLSNCDSQFFISCNMQGHNAQPFVKPPHLDTISIPYHSKKGHSWVVCIYKSIFQIIFPHLPNSGNLPLNKVTLRSLPATTFSHFRRSPWGPRVPLFVCAAGTLARSSSAGSSDSSGGW